MSNVHAFQDHFFFNLIVVQFSYSPNTLTLFVHFSLGFFARDLSSLFSLVYMTFNVLYSLYAQWTYFRFQLQVLLPVVDYYNVCICLHKKMVRPAMPFVRGFFSHLTRQFSRPWQGERKNERQKCAYSTVQCRWTEKRHSAFRMHGKGITHSRTLALCR